MKIAFVNQPWNKVTLPVREGSIAIWTYEVARRLAKSHEVVVYAKRDAGQKKNEWDEGVEYRRVSVTPDNLLQRVVRRIPTEFVKKPLLFDHAAFFLGYIVQVSMDLVDQGCDVVHVHNFSQFPPVIRAFNPHRAIMLHMHCEWLTQIRKATIEHRLRSADRIIGCSQFVADTIRRSFPERSRSCHAIQNGADIDRFSSMKRRHIGSANDEQTVLFVGRVSPEKGVHVLLDAFQLVLQRCPKARLQIVGPLGAAPREFIFAGADDAKLLGLERYFEGDYVSELQEKLRSPGGSRVSFEGRLPYVDLRDRYEAADVFVCPSVWNEPFGLPAVEAMACGLPVIASRGGGLREIVEHEKTGLLVERGDVEQLAKAMVSLLSDARMREDMGKAGRDRAVRRFSWERVVEDLSDLYNLGS